MSYLLPFFLLFAASGMFLWLLGVAFVSSERRWSENALRAPWIGWALLLGALQVVHLFSAITRTTAAGLLIVCGAGTGILLWLRVRSRPRRAVGDFPGGNLLLFGALATAALLAFLPVFNACTKEMILYDLGLYYLKTVRWIATYPIVPGLANLQGHLGFNQSGFLVTALFDAILPNRQGIFLIGGVLPWIGLASAIFSLFCLGLHAVGKLHEVPRPITVAYACSLPVWIYAFLYENLSSGSPNVVLSCLMIHLFLVFACFLYSPDERIESLGEVVVIGAACLCLKLTSVGFVFGIWAIAAVVMIRRERGWRLADTRLLPALGIGAVLLGPWFYRGILLSGYPFFPSSFLGAPVDWRVPGSVMKGFQDYIFLWSRFPHGDAATAVQGFGWIPHWFARVVPNQYQFAWPIQAGIAGAVALALFQPNRQEVFSSLRRVLLLVAPLFGFALVWFLTAPDFRYFGPLAWLFAIGPALVWISRRFAHALIACGTTLCVCAVPLACFAWENRWLWITREHALPQIPVVELEVSTNRHGLVIWYAREGNKAFDAPLPSSWGFTPDLCLLDPAKGLSGGFKHVASPARSGIGEGGHPAPAQGNTAQRAAPGTP
ncbi:MAG TPA: hypothetical protein VIT18_06600 [Terrimicrobiaceae bacterium]